MKVYIEIPDDKVKEFKKYFLYLYPVPKDEETEKPKYTELQWIKKWLYTQMIRAYQSAKKRKMMDEFSVTYDLEE